MNRTSLLPILILAAVTGCAARFGHRNEQTSIDVRTKPERISYFILLQAEAERVTEYTPSGLRVRDEPEFRKLLATQLQGLISNTTPLNYSTGSYMVAVECPGGWRFQRLDARPNRINLTIVECF